MIQQLQMTYTGYRWSRIITIITLLLCVVFLYRLSGGFPPGVWLLLFHVLPTLPLLWHVQGVAVILPLCGLLLVSLSLLLLWGVLIFVLVRVSLHWWQDFQGRQGMQYVRGDTRGVAEAAADAEQWLQGTDRAQAAAAYDFDDSNDNVLMFDLANMQTIPDSTRVRATPTTGLALQTQVVQLRVAAISDPGVVRKHKPNEDSILAVHAKYTAGVEPFPLGVFAVADGMGGHHNGQEASRLAIESLRKTLLPSLSGENREEKQCTDLLQQSIYQANVAVYQRQREQQRMMGTTITAALVFGMAAYIVNVGDSRTYLYRKSEGLRQVTRDHSLVADLVREGAISRDEMYTHPRRNEIYRCLGDGPDLELDAFRVPLQVGDSLLLCSDGLWEMVHDADIQQLIECAAPYASQMSTQLIQAALNRGGKDNVSVVTVCMTQDADVYP